MQATTRTLSIDLETYSSVDLKEDGLYKYIASKDFEIIIFAYKLDNQPTVVCDDDIPDEIIAMLTDPNVIKKAFNAKFEIMAIEKHFEIKLDKSQWYCTMILAGMCGYPLSLDSVGKAMNLEVQKDKAGKALIKMFTMPPRQKRSGPNWEAFKEYAGTDVDVEHAIANRLSFMTIKQMERNLWLLDNKINDVGILLDIEFVEQAVYLKQLNDEILMNEAKELTRLENPNSPPQIKKWLSTELNREIVELTKDSIKELLECEEIPDHVRRMLELRQEMSKSSLEKYQTMLDMAGADGRMRGLHQLYGAPKTGRWAGRGIQPQNLTPTKIDNIDLARQIVREGDYEKLQMLYGNVASSLSALIRTALIGSGLLTVSDFSAIEARITAWFANETWRLDVFKGDGKIYEASAAMMFKVDISEVDKAMRSKGKVAELALGYQGSVGAMERMGALKMGLKREELKPIVDLWRKTSPNIVKLWDDVNRSAIQCIENPGRVVKLGLLRFQVKHGTMFIQLPSGRCLSYVKPYLKTNKFQMTGIGYMSVDQKTNQWSHQETYGGKLVENIVQGTARDVLAAKMLALDEAGNRIILHVHDEVVMESADAQAVTEIMEQDLEWAPGLPLRAATFTTPYYIKD